MSKLFSSEYGILRFLANIQRDGTYSVVPRVAGGEILPDHLIAIGEVARDYGLYTKITGGKHWAALIASN